MRGLGLLLDIADDDAEMPLCVKFSILCDRWPDMTSGENPDLMGVGGLVVGC